MFRTITDPIFAILGLRNHAIHPEKDLFKAKQFYMSVASFITEEIMQVDWRIVMFLAAQQK